MDIILQRMLSLIPRKDNGGFKHGEKKKFAEKIGLKSGNLISDWIAGRSTTYKDYVFWVAYQYNVSPEWLRGETDDPTPTSFATSENDSDVRSFLARFSALDAHGREAVLAILAAEENRIAEAQKQEANKIVSIPTIRHYFSSPAAGPSGMEAGEDYEDIPMPEDAPKNADYCLTVSGDSMEPYFPDGSMAYVLRDAPLAEFDVGIFIVDGVAHIKQICHGMYGEIYLLSANPKREDANITLKPDGDRRMEYRGKVIVKKKLPQPIYD